MKFIPGNKDPGLQKWADRGITKIGDLCDDGTFISFEALKKRHDIPLKNFFKYLQLRSYIAQSQNQSLACPGLNELEKLVVHHSSSHGQISLFYNLLKTNTRVLRKEETSLVR